MEPLKENTENKKVKAMQKRRPVKRKKKMSKGRLAYMKAMRSPDDVTWQDVADYQNEMYQPQPPSPPLRERLQNVDMGMRPEQAERVVKDTRSKWKKFKGIFDKSKNLATKGGKTALTSGRRVIHMGQEYTTKLDRQAEQQLADIEKDYWKGDTGPGEDETQYVEYEEPEINEDIEEPSIAEEAAEPNIEGYTRRKHRKIKKVKKRRMKKKKVSPKKKRVKRRAKHKRIKKRRKR
jgi:hypothetical protein